jgi:hypothetical protein
MVGTQLPASKCNNNTGADVTTLKATGSGAGGVTGGGTGVRQSLHSYEI